MAVSSIFCGHCGAQNPTTEYFCFSCGYTLSVSATTALASSSSTLTGMLPAHTLLRQRYRVLHAVGQGGMGAVYLAQDTSLGDRLVAIKEMSQNNTQQSQEAIENFKREAHLLASLQHPNLPSIYDHFEENGRWYLVMSFIQGETLEDYLSRVQGHKLPLEEVLHIGQELCNVLNYLHVHQPPIIFRDLKPGNVMRNTDGHIYLIDFGIARHFKPGQAKDTANYGSAGYAPPEQYGKAQTTERSDIYSLGATLYEMLSGYDPSQSPFTLPPLQSLVPTLPDRLVKLITQMLDMDANKRPVSIKVVQQELHQANIPTPSRPQQPTRSRQARPVRPYVPPPALKRYGAQSMLSIPAQGSQIYIQQQQDKSKTTAALLCFFLGWAGAHRFYVGKKWSGLVQLFTFGGYGIWWLIDFIMILGGNFKDSNGLLLLSTPVQSRKIYNQQSHSKDKTTVVFLCIFLGWAGAHRFYVGKIWSGLTQLFTFSGFGIWWLVDFIMIVTDNFKDSNGILVRKRQQYVQSQPVAKISPIPTQPVPIKKIFSLTMRGMPTTAEVVVTLKRTLPIVGNLLWEALLFIGMIIVTVIGGVSALALVFGSLFAGKEAFADLAVGILLFFSGLLLLSIIRISSASRKILPIPARIEITIGKFSLVVAIIFGCIVTVIGIITNTPSNNNSAGAAVVDIFSVIEALSIWLITYLRTKKNP